MKWQWGYYDMNVDKSTAMNPSSDVGASVREVLRGKRQSRQSQFLVTAALLPILGASVAFAQTDTPSGTGLEEVVVTATGIRGAIVESLEIKRDADVIVETIRAEDIGKMPDVNLAEALQRVAGIAIDRDGGEGRYVTMRGFGPAFNSVLFNGRRLATSEYDRSFGFDTIASDLVGAINVYKTQESFLREGGIGGTIDVRSFRPLDRPGFNVSGRAEGNYEDNSDEMTPNGGLVVSDTFMDDTLGVQVAASYQRRKNRTYFAGYDWTLRNIDSFTAWHDALNIPFTYSNFGVENAYHLQELDRNVLDETRTRRGAYADIQYKPNEDLEFNVDYLYSDFEVIEDRKQVGNWFFELEPPPTTSLADLTAGIRNLHPEVSDADIANYHAYLLADSQTRVDSNGVLLSASTAPGHASQAFNGEINRRPTNTQMIGSNMKWRLSDKLALTVDVAYSKADLDNYGANQNIRRSLENLDAGSFLYQTNGQGVPYLSDLSPTLTASMTNTDHLFFRSQFDTGTKIHATNKEASFHIDYEASDTLKVRLGALGEIGDKESAKYETPTNIRNLWARFGAGKLPLTPQQLSQMTYGLYTSDPAQFGMPASADNNTFRFNYPGMIAFATNPANLQALLAANTSLASSDPAQYAELQRDLAEFQQRIANNPADPYYAVPTGVGYNVEEKVTSVYLDATKRFTLFGMDSMMTAGLRYANTRTESSGYTRILTGLAIDPSDTSGQGLIPTYADPNGPGGLTYATEDNSYSNWLPTLNLRVNVTDEVIARFAASKTLARPQLDYLAPQFTYGALSVNGRTANSNNPDLKPLTSTNLDIAVEWYYGVGGALTFDAFWKDVDGFITSEIVENVVIPTVEPDIYNTFTVTRPTNAEAVKVYGGTLGWTHTFDFGLGWQANYTWTDTNRPFDPVTYSATRVALPGLSDNANLILFYEQGPLSTRLAYNWREKFLSKADFGGGLYASTLEPVFTKAYDQIDARIGYTFRDVLQIYVEGVNLENSRPMKVGRFDNLFISSLNYGRRYILGISATF